MGIEPTWDSPHCPTPDLKSGSPTSELGTSGRFITKIRPSVEGYWQRAWDMEPGAKVQGSGYKVQGINGFLISFPPCTLYLAPGFPEILTTDYGHISCGVALLPLLIYDCSWFFPSMKMRDTECNRP